MEDRCWLNCFRGHLATCIIRFTTSSPSRLVVTLLSLHSSQSSPSPPWLARCFSFRLVLRHANAFLCPSPRRCCICLSHIVSDSDVCASVSVSCSRSCPQISAEFCSCGVPPESILLSSGLPHSRSAFLRMSHILHCCQRVVLASASRSDLLQDLRGLLRCQHGP